MYIYTACTCIIYIHTYIYDATRTIHYNTKDEK